MGKSLFFVERSASIANDTMAAAVTALSIIPQTLLFAFLSGVEPTTALFSALVINTVYSALRGKAIIISTPVTALSAIMISIIGEYGYIYLVAIGLLAGVLQLLIGGFGLGKFIRLLPRTVVLGFINGIVIVTMLNQLNFFYTSIDGEITWLATDKFIYTLGLSGLAWAIIYYFPFLTKKISSTLIAVVVVGVLVYALNLKVYSFGEYKKWIDFGHSATLKPVFKGFLFPHKHFDWLTFLTLTPYAALLAVYSSTQSLVTLSFADDLSQSKGQGNKEIIAIGTANVVSSLFGGVIGAANIEQSIVNYKSGGRTRLTGWLTSAFLGAFLFLIPQTIGKVPIPIFIGLILGVVGGSFTWSSFKIFNKFQKMDAFVLILVTVVTIFSNPAVAVLSGVFFAALVFAWNNALRIRVRKNVDEAGVKQYEIYGPLFFGSTSLFQSKFKPENDPAEIILNFYESRIWDHSGIEAIKELSDKYIELGKKVKIKHVSSDTRLLLNKAGAKQVEFLVTDHDPQYHVVEEETPLKFY